jgi:hypothetical protein
VPAISSDPGILGAARSAIDVLLQFKGFLVVLSRKGVAPAMPGGGHGPALTSDLAPQTFSWVQTGSDEVLDGDNGDTPTVKRTYVLTGRYDADIRVDDVWVDAYGRYRVDTVDSESGFKTTAEVTAFVKVS